MRADLDVLLDMLAEATVRAIMEEASAGFAEEKGALPKRPSDAEGQPGGKSDDAELGSIPF